MAQDSIQLKMKKKHYSPSTNDVVDDVVLCTVAGLPPTSPPVIPMQQQQSAGVVMLHRQPSPPQLHQLPPRPPHLSLVTCHLCFDYLCQRRRLCFYFGLFVCPSDNWKSCELILTKFLGGVGHDDPGTKWWNFGNDPDHRPDPGVRNPIHWIIENLPSGLRSKLHS